MNRYVFTDEQRALLEGLSQPIAIYQFLDKRVVTVLLSDGFREVFGYKNLEEAYFDMDNNMYKYAHPDDIARISEVAYRFATEDAAYEVVYRTKSKYLDEYRIIHAKGKHVYTDDGARLAHVWYIDEGMYAVEDESEQTELSIAFRSALREESIVRENNYDYLTGLPSMTYFFDLATEGKKEVQEKGEEPVMLYMDLTGMKFFNRQHSYSEGDSLLREFSAVLKNTFSDRNCCRVGADHFAAYTGETGLEDKLSSFFESCAEINGGLSLPVRVGIYSNRMGDVLVSTACDRAKFACDALQNTYESCFNYYDSDLRDEEEIRHYVLANLDRALEEQWIQVFYQPIVRAMNGRVCDEEALSRWIDPELGMLPPCDFIPVLEDAGVIHRVDLYVLDQILEKMRLQGEAGLPIVPCSINLSRSDFTACDIVKEIVQRVDAAGINRDRITIEITESVIGSNPEFIKERVACFRDLGFSVWMDDFGSGYSSIDLLQSMEFDLIKFDMSFMKQLEEGGGGKVVLTELVKMATTLGADTLCEGVETEKQVQFLREIGCSKLQGFYFCRPIPFKEILERYETGIQLGFENPAESDYYDAVGRVSLYDLAVIASEGDSTLQKYFSTLPMGVFEMDSENVNFMRTNESYREFFKRYFNLEMMEGITSPIDLANEAAPGLMRLVRQCCDMESRAFFDETMPDGTSVHSFIRYIGANPVNGMKAVAVAVLSVSEPNDGTTYAEIARALAVDYYNIYYVDLDTETFVEYSSQVGGVDLAIERHGENFFESAKTDTMTRIYKEDRDQFLASFTKENVIRELDRQGTFTATYRLLDNGEPMYVNMKVSRMRNNAQKIIVGISIVDSQMKQREHAARMERERDVFMSVAALSGNFLVVYSIDVETERYIEYRATRDFESLGIAKEGEGFFQKAIENGERVVYPEDLQVYKEKFTKDNVMRQIEEAGAFNMQYRLMINGVPQPVSLRIAKVEESSVDKLVAGIRVWQTRQA